jgi:hypothetical protein
LDLVGVPVILGLRVELGKGMLYDGWMGGRDCGVWE